MKRLKVFVSAISAGMCIGFGGVAFLSVDSKVLGAMLFMIGLFVVCTFGLHLFTGKVCYVFNNDKDYALNLPIIWIGNLVGTGIIALAVRFSRISNIADRAIALCQIKLDDSLLSLFLLGILCNIFIYIAVDGYKSNPHELGKYLALFFGVMVFCLSATEHCVADMFYFWVAGMWNLKAIVCVIVITLGNAVGSVIFPFLQKFIAE